IDSLEFKNLVHQCDIGLVNLNGKFTIPNFPSKALDYFEAQIPVLAAIDQNTDYGQFLDETKAGLWSITGDLDAYCRNFEQLLNNKALRKELGQNGRLYLERNLNVQKTYATIMKHFV
ncbi:MAG: glycosyltransferase WbuB, partial [Candidatus Bathyarchaeia archaeon]